MPSPDAVVRCRDVHLRYGETDALAGLDLTVRRGRIHGLLGPNGAGKSTLLRLLLGLARPDGGEVEVLGRDPAGGGPALAGVAGFVDAPTFHPYLGVARTLTALATLDGGRARDRVDAAMTAVGVAHLRDRKVGRLSTGQRQRVAMAAALLRDPELLVVDEPTTGLDPEGLAALREFVTDLAAAGRTVLLSSHDMDEVDRLCDDVTVVHRGRVAHSGPLAALRERAVVATHRLRTSDPARAAVVLRATDGLDVLAGADGVTEVSGPADQLDALVLSLAAAGVAVRELVPVRTALEVEFLRLVGADDPVAA